MAAVRHQRDDDQVAAQPESGVPVLLLPGTLCDARVFGRLVELLPPMDTRMVELRGAESANALARRILAAAPPRFALIGFSLGGIVALEIASLAPHRVAGLALISTNPDAVDLSEFAARRTAAIDATKRGMAVHVAEYLCEDYRGARELDPAVRDLLVDMACDAPPDSFRQQTEIALTRVDSRTRLAACGAPTLVIGGDADRVTPIAVQHSLTIPGAVFATVPGAGHFALLENPAAVADRLAQWYSRLSPVSATASTAL
jgi:pimeloyl-ACP methyl ester carboxylesterase